MTTQLFVDPYTLLRIARAIEARAQVLQTGGRDRKANNAFEKALGMPYATENTIPALEDYDQLRAALIALLEAEIAVREAQAKINRKIKRAKSCAPLTGLFDLEIERDKLWETYEVIRRLTAYELKSLVVERA